MLGRAYTPCMLNYKKLQDRPRDFLAATSLTLEEFLRLWPAFEAAYLQRSPRELTHEGKPRQRRVGGGATGALPSMTDKLLFIFVYAKTHPLHIMHA
jgi:hypothetical protein